MPSLCSEGIEDIDGGEAIDKQDAWLKRFESVFVQRGK